MNGGVQQANPLSGDGERFMHGNRDGFYFICQRSEEAKRAINSLLPDPDELFRSARIVKPGTRTHGGSLTIDGVNYFLKRYNDRGFWYRLRHAFIPSRAVRTWGIAWLMLEAGIPVPEPLVCMEQRRFRLLYRSYVLMRFTSGCKRLRDIWSDLADQSREELLILLAEIIARMHCAGALHGDLKWDNILVAPNELAKICIVDLDGSRFISRVDNKLAEKDLQRFLRDLAQFGSTSLSEKFMETWRKRMLIG